MSMAYAYALGYNRAMDFFGASETEKQQRETSCLSKLTWQTREEAVAARAYAGWQYGDSGGRPQPYTCRHCHKWHLARRAG